VVAIFGRNTARQRLRRAARESIAIPVFSTPADCAPWVTGGLWPPELSTITTQTAPLVTHLKADLQRIVNDANNELKRLRMTGLPDQVRSAHEARIINEARGFAIRRVESTVRTLRNTTKPPSQHPPPSDGHADTTTRFKLAPALPAPPNSVETSEPSTDFSANEPPDPAPPTDVIHNATPPTDVIHNATPPTDVIGNATTPTDVIGNAATPTDSDTREPHKRPHRRAPETEDTEVIAEITSLLHDLAPTADDPATPTARPAPIITPPSGPERVITPAPAPERVISPPPVSLTETTPHPVAQRPPESEHERLERMLKFVARQEPGVRWAIGNRDDGATLLVTDFAHGWIPPAITLPADVELLEPARRTGTAMALLGNTSSWMTYAPGDALGWPGDYDATDTSPQPRDLPQLDDLGWALGEATQWRDGLPRIVNTVAKAGAAGTGVVNAEIDTLRTHLDTARQQLLAQYPHIEAGLLLNYLLLAATDAMATSDLRSANYHFAWFQTLSAPPRRW
jgi:hypothetical protein